jgi:hypothetical protein
MVPLLGNDFHQAVADAQSESGIGWQCRSISGEECLSDLLAVRGNDRVQRSRSRQLLAIQWIDRSGEHDHRISRRLDRSNAAL